MNQRKLGYLVNIQMFDNSARTFTSLECKEHVKYLGTLLDSNLSWKFHIEYVAFKISKIIGVIARLGHFFFYLSFPDVSLLMSYGLAAWGQATKTHLQKLLVLQKRVLRLVYFFLSREHTTPINMLYVETVYYLIYDVS